MKHVMIDIETMGRDSDAAIISIGAVLFEFPPDCSIDLEHTFKVNVKLQSSIDRGGTLNADTILWWLDQNEPARKEIINNQNSAMHIEQALHELSKWYLASGAEFVWSEGSDFDLVIIANAYKKTHKPQPWQFRNTRDTRTLYWLSGHTKEMRIMPTVEHDCLEDAIAQAKTVQEAYKMLLESQI
jgi:hypothetical protein